VTRTRWATAAALALVALALTAAACGDDDEGDNAATTTETQTSETVPATTPEESGEPEAKKVKPSASEADLSRKPKIAKGKGQPPSTLVIEDLVVGKGKRAAPGDTVSVRYVGALFETGDEFDASWEGNSPGKAFRFPLGAGQVIQGWDQGVAGMRESGRRKLTIPGHLAYGAQGYPPDIPPDAALVFVIDLKRVS
jgi:peptidylprolyl isomerase